MPLDLIEVRAATTALATRLKNIVDSRITTEVTGVTVGTYNNSTTKITPFTVNAQGQVTAVGTAVTVTPAWTSITGKPTTLAGYGIVDAAPLTSPALNGTPTAPTALATNNSNQIATTAYVTTAVSAKANTVHTHAISDVTDLQTTLNAKAPLVSPALTGAPTAPTASAGTNTTQIATTAFVIAQMSSAGVAGTAAINGGAIDGAVIGGTTPAAANFTTLNTTTVSVGGATPISGSSSAVNIDYIGAGTQYGMTLQATTPGNTTAVNFFNSAGTSVGSITQTDTGITFNGAATSVAWSGVTGKPTTLAGYGITDAVAASTRGVANGVATLDASGLVPSSQLPSYVDDVLEYTSLVGFPATGVSSKIYVANDTNKIYRWSGSAYIEISPVAGNADTATKLATARTIDATGDATWSVSFDGSANVSAAITLANSGVTAGTYNNSATQNIPIVVDAKGRVTGVGSGVTITPAWTSITGKPTTLAGYGITDALALTGGTLTGSLNLPTNGLNVGSGQLQVSGGNVTASGSVTAPTLNATTYARIGGTGVVTNATLYVSGTAVQNVTNVVAENIAWNAGNYFTKTISGATAFTFSNFPASGFAMLTLKLTNGGSAAVTWPASVKWSGGEVPALTTAGVDIINLFTDDGGVTVYGIFAGKGMA